MQKCLDPGLRAVRAPSELFCPLCGRRYDFELEARMCPSCRTPLFLKLVEPSMVKAFFSSRPRLRPGPGVWSFPLATPCPPPSSSLGEGFTPSVESQRLAAKLGASKLLVKNESTNPTGTFIDRGSAVGVWVAKCFGRRRVLAAGLGDYVVSVSSYAAFHGVEAVTYVPASTPLGKLYRAILAGAKVIQCESLSVCISEAESMLEASSFLCLHASPLFIEGYKTLLYELAMHSKVDHVVVPVGDGVLLASLYKASLELEEAGIDSPRLYGVLVRGEAKARTLEELVEGDPRVRILAEKASAESGGKVVQVEARDVLRAVYHLARTVGVLVDPSAAAGLAGASRLAEEGVFERKDVVAVVVTGSSIRDPLTLMEVLECTGCLRRAPQAPPEPLHPTKLAILRALAEEGRAVRARDLAERIAAAGVRISLPTLLAHLKWLEARGYVASKRVGRRRAYTITEQGLELLRVLSEA